MNSFSILALGGNAPSRFGPPEVTLQNTIQTFKKFGIVPLKYSNLYRNPAFPKGSGPDYVNAVALVETNHSAPILLQILHQIEADFERSRTTRWGSRTLDIDLIAHGEAIQPDLETFSYWRDLSLDQQKELWLDQLILPHPRLQDRAFVLVPLAEVCSDWCHPVSGLTVAEMLAALPEEERKEVIAL